MAEIAIAIAIAVLRQAVGLLGNLIIQEGSHLFKLKDDMEWIENEMGYIQAYLEDADNDNSMQIESKVEAELLKNIRLLAFDVEDIVETYFPHIASSHERTGCLRSWLKSVNCILCHSSAYHKCATEIEGIKRRVENIPRVRNAYESRSGSSSSGDIWEKRRHNLHRDEPIVVGFDEHIKTLEAKLLDPDLKNRVVSIVGMPGLGKTTLAKKVFDSVTTHVNEEEHRFQCSAKVYVSQTPNVTQLFQEIAKQVGLEREEWEENVEANLSAYLRGKRYVILIDDIWDTQAWGDIQNGIPTNCENGSRIILTSRNNEVGLLIGGVSSLYELQPLEPEESWNLFTKMVMDPLEITNDTGKFQELEPFGRKIVGKCGCVPLAIVVVAGLLLVKEKTEHAWKGILDSMGQDDDMCSKILALSYKDLPIHLKPCFLYFGLFPEDYEIFAFQLINLWVAEGFVQGKGQRLPEDVGEDYLDQLINRNIVQVARRKYDGRIRSCRIHDLLHNVCVRVATESNFFDTHNHATPRNFAMRGVRRVTIYDNSVWEYISSNFQTSRLRTILCFPEKERRVPKRKQVNKFFQGSRFLRVLSVDCHDLPFQLPNQIGNLRHLRYFRCEHRSIKLPLTMGKLKNLTTLDIQIGHRIHIPKAIWEMEQLRHIVVDKRSIQWPPQDCRDLVCKYSFRQSEVSLPNLQTLYVVPGRLLEAEWLHKCPNLRKLGISNPTKSIIKVLSEEAPVSNKLEILRLSVNHRYENEEATLTKLDLSRYESLRKLHLQIPMGKFSELGKLPLNLIKLTLVNAYLVEDPMVTLKELPKLNILKLGSFSYIGKKMVCSGGPDKFPQLEVLEIDLQMLNQLVVEEDGMPRLKKLSYKHCNAELMIPERIKSIMIVI
ncbi:Disease resistance protein RPP13 [Camellia lanceoleosa]|uniref:Disease resistance protein RPP13 n=1 Tax=Camellia lanceoleosa TaxID=1840588 RepID=A0ACC0I8F1_9ERIC|nr:Disease resistance protein RPP13 [Camellia lanceoleosa]